MQFYKLDEILESNISTKSNFLFTDIDRLRNLTSLRQSIISSIDDLRAQDLGNVTKFNLINEIFNYIQIYKTTGGDTNDFKYFEQLVFHGLCLPSKVYQMVKGMKNDPLLQNNRHKTLRLFLKCCETSDDTFLTTEEFKLLRSAPFRLPFILFVLDKYPNLKCSDTQYSDRESFLDEMSYVVDRKDETEVHDRLHVFDDDIAPSSRVKFSDKGLVELKIDVEFLSGFVEKSCFVVNHWLRSYQVNHLMNKEKTKNDIIVLSEMINKRYGSIGSTIVIIITIIVTIINSFSK